MRSGLPLPFGRSLAAALLAAVTLAACDDNGGGEAESVATPTETKPAAGPSDNVRAAAEAVWPAPVETAANSVTVALTRPNLMAVVDMSGSMSEPYCAGDYDTRAEAARAALTAWLDSVPAEANMGLVIFEQGRVSLPVPLGTGNRDAFLGAINRTLPAGNTPLRDALALARQELEAQALRQRGYGEYRVVVITDGAHSDGQDPAPVIEGIFANYANPIEVHTIGFCINKGHPLNDPGRIFYTNAMSPDDLRAGLNATQGEAASFDPSTETFEELTR